MQTNPEPNISYVLRGSLAAWRETVVDCAGPARRYPAGQVLTRTGELAPTMYFLLEGIVKIYTTDPGGHVRTLGYHKPDTLFALDRLCPGLPSVVCCESVTPISVVPVTWEQLCEIAAAREGFWEALTQYVGEVLRLMCFDAETRSHGDVTSRLASFLCLFVRYQAGEGNPDASVIRLTQDELASAVGASRVQVARVCASLKARGLIRSMRGAVQVTELEGLRALALREL